MGPPKPQLFSLLKGGLPQDSAGYSASKTVSFQFCAPIVVPFTSNSEGGLYQMERGRLVELLISLHPRSFATDTFAAKTHRHGGADTGIQVVSIPTLPPPSG